MSVTEFWDLTLCSFKVTYCGKICCFSLRICLLKTQAAGSVETVSPVH